MYHAPITSSCVWPHSCSGVGGSGFTIPSLSFHTRHGPAPCHGARSHTSTTSVEPMPFARSASCASLRRGIDALRAGVKELVPQVFEARGRLAARVGVVCVAQPQDERCGLVLVLPDWAENCFGRRAVENGTAVLEYQRTASHRSHLVAQHTHRRHGVNNGFALTITAPSFTFQFMGKTQRILKAWRKKMGLSQAQAARKLRGLQGQLSEWERGGEPRSRWAERISKVCQ